MDLKSKIKSLLEPKDLKGVLFFILTFIFPVSALAHTEEIIQSTRIDELFSSLGTSLVIISSIIVTIVVLLALTREFQSELFKKISFITIVIVVSIPTLFLSISTVYLNIISSSGGPVHWHADFEIYNCGQHINLIDPSGLSNRIGTPVLHEHNDDRIHVEGVVLEAKHANLSEFFHVIGGDMFEDSISLPIEGEGLRTIKDGQSCPNGQPGKWQVFLYKTDIHAKTITQTKLDDYQNYILSPYGVVPPGDCIIFEFDSLNKNKTENICNFHEIEINKGNFQLIK